MAASGSPPRAWGQLLFHVVEIAEWRFTPTRVGTTSPEDFAPSVNAVHPHARGDNLNGSVADDYPDGSPPRAWGQRKAFPRYRPPDRFTPTRVGTTPSVLVDGPGRTVHPHARGDNQFVGTDGQRGGGSPPRAWGQHLFFHQVRRISRFTPTRVGTTRQYLCTRSQKAVHPHARGDNVGVTHLLRIAGGSPPRAWGQRRNALRFALAYRFTPTRVGTTE